MICIEYQKIKTANLSCPQVSRRRITDYRDFSKRKEKEPLLPNWTKATILYPSFAHLSARRLECTNRFKTDTAFRL